MNIYSKPGSKVIFSIPNAGTLGDEHQAKKHLTLGEQYTVKSTDVWSFHTIVYLEEVPGVAFNSVQFENVDDAA